MRCRSSVRAALWVVVVALAVVVLPPMVSVLLHAPLLWCASPPVGVWEAGEWPVWGTGLEVGGWELGLAVAVGLAVGVVYALAGGLLLVLAARRFEREEG